MTECGVSRREERMNEERMREGTLSEAVNGPLKREVFSTDLSNPFVHPSLHSLYIYWTPTVYLGI